MLTLVESQSAQVYDLFDVPEYNKRLFKRIRGVKAAALNEDRGLTLGIRLNEAARDGSIPAEWLECLQGRLIDPIRSYRAIAHLNDEIEEQNGVDIVVRTYPLEPPPPPGWTPSAETYIFLHSPTGQQTEHLLLRASGHRTYLRS